MPHWKERDDARKTQSTATKDHPLSLRYSRGTSPYNETNLTSSRSCDLRSPRLAWTQATLYVEAVKEVTNHQSAHGLLSLPHLNRRQLPRSREKSHRLLLLLLLIEDEWRGRSRWDGKNCLLLQSCLFEKSEDIIIGEPQRCANICHAQ